MRPSFSENPLLRVSRPVSACSRCRSAKVRCDGKLPACTACEKAGREGECSSANDQFARGKERSYVAALELRIEKLQKRLAYAKLRKASVAQHDPDPQLPGPPPDRKDSLSLIRAAIHRKAARTRENSDVNSLVSDFGFLSVNATTRDFEPSVTNMTFARLVLAATVNEPLPMPTEPLSLPPRQSAQATVQYYMENVYPLLPSFAETTLLTILNDVYHEDDRVVSDSDRWMLLLVLGIGMVAQSRQAGDQFYTAGTEYVTHALEYADNALAPGYPSQIQCLLLLTQFAMLDPAHFDSWLLIGFASRAVVDLGFHQDLPPQSAPDKGQLDMRRKIFYCVYALDRAISMVHARAFSFTDNTVNVAFPMHSVPQGLPLHGPQPADPALLHFQLRRAQSHWYQDLCQSRIDAIPDPQAYIWRMCRDMREWNEHLPNSLAPAVRELFDLELRYSYVYCIGARAQLLTDYSRLLIFEHAITYLDTIYNVAHNPKNTGFYTYHDALKVYFMASQLVAVLRDAEDLLLSGAPIAVPMPPQSGQLGPSVAPPPLPGNRHRVPGENNLTRSLRCLEGVPKTLGRWGERWVDALQLSESFELVFGEVMERLRTRKTVEDTIKAQRDPSPPIMQQHPQHPHHQHHHSQPGFSIQGPPSAMRHQNSMPPQQQAQMHSPISQPLSHEGLTVRPVSQPHMSPQMVSPQMVSPQMVSPQMVSPQMVSPQMVSPQIVSPYQHVQTPVMQPMSSPHPATVRWMDMEMARMMQNGMSPDQQQQQQQSPQHHIYIKSEHDI